MINSRVKTPFPLEAPAYACSLAERVSGLSGLRAVQALAANAAYRPERANVHIFRKLVSRAHRVGVTMRRLLRCLDRR